MCRDCWYAQQRPNKRKHYRRHRDRILGERREYREQHAERKALADVLYHWRHKDERNKASRQYYWLNRERILAKKKALDERPLSLDYGWEDDLRHDALPFGWWQEQQVQAGTLDDLLCDLSVDDISLIEKFLSGEIDIEQVQSVIEEIRKKGKL